MHPQPSLGQAEAYTLTTLTTLAGRLARLEKKINHKDTEALRKLSGGKSLGELAQDLLNLFDPDFLVAEVQKSKFGDPFLDALLPEPTDSELSALRASVVQKACAPFDSPPLRDALAKAKQDAEQTIDIVTVDTVLIQGFGAAAKAKAQSPVQSFRAYVESHKAEIAALQILYSRPTSSASAKTCGRNLTPS
jgi:type I restriction enzyme R subunit